MSNVTKMALIDGEWFYNYEDPTGDEYWMDTPVSAYEYMENRRKAIEYFGFLPEVTQVLYYNPVPA